MKVVLNIDFTQLIKLKTLVYKMKVTIYGREKCSWCSKAKDLANNLLQSQVIDNYEYIDYQKENMSADDLSKIVGTQVKTVPIILLDGNYIGGYTELEENFK